jgi:hypothetical protein
MAGMVPAGSSLPDDIDALLIQTARLNGVDP